MLYLEAPAGVGYSYSADKNYTTDDDQVSEVITPPPPTTSTNIIETKQKANAYYQFLSRCKYCIIRYKYNYDFVPADVTG